MRELAPFLCFVVVAFSGVYLGDRTAAARRCKPRARVRLQAAPQPPRTPPPATARARGSRRSVRLLREFYSVPVSDESAAKSAPLTALHSDLASRELAESVRFMIATLSDPIESSADHFDPFLDAMQRAFEAEGMVIDRHYLPWKDVLDGRGRTKTGDPIYRDEPGVVLFREIPPPGGAGQAPAPPPRVVAVLIVGENPISGIHKRAFGEALDVLADWPTTTSAAPLRIPILGPTYSGTAASLRLALEDWMDGQCQHTVVEFLSGSAMALNNKRYLEFSIPTNQHGAALLSNFHAATLSSKELQDTFFREYLVKRLHAGLDQVVMLTEANTAYGASRGAYAR